MKMRNVGHSSMDPFKTLDEVARVSQRLIALCAKPLSNRKQLTVVIGEKVKLKNFKLDFYWFKLELVK